MVLRVLIISAMKFQIRELVMMRRQVCIQLWLERRIFWEATGEMELEFKGKCREIKLWRLMFKVVFSCLGADCKERERTMVK